MSIGYSLSAGLFEIRIEKNAIKEASKSRNEWIASDKMATEPVKSPTMIFRITTRELLLTDKKATFDECIIIHFQ